MSAHHRPFVPPAPGAASDEPPAIADLLRARRGELGLSLTALAQRAGCSRSYLSMIEGPSRPPPSDAVLESLERALDLRHRELREAAWWARTPEPIRAKIRRMRDADASPGVVGLTLSAPTECAAPVSTAAGGDPAGMRSTATIPAPWPGLATDDVRAARVGGRGLAPLILTGDVVVVRVAVGVRECPQEAAALWWWRAEGVLWRQLLRGAPRVSPAARLVACWPVIGLIRRIEGTERALECETGP